MEHVAVPRHAIGNHHEGRAVLDQVPGLKGVLGEGSRAVAFAILGRELLEVEEVGTAHQSLDPLEHGILRRGRGRFSFVLVLPSQEPAQGITRLVILG